MLSSLRRSIRKFLSIIILIIPTAARSSGRLALVLALLATTAWAEPIAFQLPAQAVDAALLAFSQQTGTEILFSSDELAKVRSNAVTGRYEPIDALSRLLQGTGFIATATPRGKFVIKRVARTHGSVAGRLRSNDGSPACARSSA